jgi:thioesterase domain-containing protein
VSRHTAGADDVLVPIQTQGRGSPFYCVHPIGGSVLCYAELARQLGSDRPFYGLQAADAGETSIEAMAARYVDAIRTVQAEGPYLLGGWSMGGLIAYEMAHALRTQGQETALLALVDSFPPVSSNGNGHIDERHLFDAFVADLAAVPGIRLPASEDVQSLTADGRLDRALDRLKRAHILAEEIDAPQFERMWQRYGANYRALAAYVPAPQSGRLTVIMAAESDATAHRTPIATWGPLAGGGLSIDVLPGDHYSLLRHPTVRLTAGTLAAFLRSTDALVTQ